MKDPRLIIANKSSHLETEYYRCRYTLIITKLVSVAVNILIFHEKVLILIDKY